MDERQPPSVEKKKPIRRKMSWKEKAFRLVSAIGLSLTVLNSADTKVIPQEYTGGDENYQANPDNEVQVTVGQGERIQPWPEIDYTVGLDHFDEPHDGSVFSTYGTGGPDLRPSSIGGMIRADRLGIYIYDEIVGSFLRDGKVYYIINLSYFPITPLNSGTISNRT